LYDEVDKNNNAYTYFGVDTAESDFSGGIRIQGVVDSNPVNKADSDSPITTGLTVAKAIYTSSKYYGDSVHAICDGSSQGVSGGSTKDLGKSFTIHAPKITLQSNGRPKIEDDSTTFTYNMPDAADVGADPAGTASTEAASALAAAKKYAKELFDSIDLSNYLEKNTAYTIYFP
jgi:hypothetical protein